MIFYNWIIWLLILWTGRIGKCENVTSIEIELQLKEQQHLPLSKSFHIGGIVPNEEYEIFFQQEIEKLNFDGVSVSQFNTLYGVAERSSGNPIRDAEIVCAAIIPQRVSVIILGGDITPEASATVSFTAGFYRIPVIGTRRESTFSDKNVHVSFLRTVAPYNHQADVWVELIKILKFRQVIFLHSSDSEGRSILNRLQNHFDNLRDEFGIELSSIVEFSPGERSISDTLLDLKNTPIRVVLLFSNEEDSNFILGEATDLGLTGPEWLWIVAENALYAENIPEGSLGVRLMHADDHRAHISDSLEIVALSLRQLQENKPLDIFPPPYECGKDFWDQTGDELFKIIQNQTLLRGMTGKVAFDQNGDRLHSEYAIINIQKCSEINTDCHYEDEFVNVGKYYYNKEKDKMDLVVNENTIRWGGGSTTKPSGIQVKRHLKVYTIEEIPFVYVDDCEDGNGTICLWRNPLTAVEEKRFCYGYCIELLERLSEASNFTYSLHLPSDGLYGEMEFINGQRVWNGMIGEVLNSNADMIIAPLTINPERAKVMDFSKPFKYQGITILVKKEKDKPALVSILQPFQLNLWLMLLVTVHGIALMIWLLDRLSPMFKQNGSQTDSLKMSEAFWFSWGVILNSGLGEGTPRCLSARVISMIWAGFAMIIVASYTANLAAFLVLDDGVVAITGINDAKLRNPVESFIFATVKGSSVDMFFRRKSEWANMYRVMEANNYPSADEAIEAVKNESLQAFIWDSSRLEYAASQDCQLITVGEIFGRSGFGIGLQKGSFWTEEITLNILDFHEKGYMSGLDDRWIWDEDDLICPPDSSNSPKRLGLANLEGIFIMIMGGVAGGCVLIIIEIVYFKYDKKETPRANEAVEDLGDRFNSEDVYGRGKRSEGEESSGEDYLEMLYKSLERNSIETRLSESVHIPDTCKDTNPSNWLKYYMPANKPYRPCRHIVPSCEELRDMLQFVEKNNISLTPCNCNGLGETIDQKVDSDNYSSVASELSCNSFSSDGVDTLAECDDNGFYSTIANI